MGPELMPAPRRRVIERLPGDASSPTPNGSDPGLLYRLHVRDVSRWARRFGVCDADIEDVVHDVFMVAFRKLATFDPARAAFGTWLFGVTARVAQARRRRERWRVRIRRACPWWNDEATPQGACGQVDLDGATSRHPADEDAASLLLRSLLDDIGEKYRTAIVMFELEGLSCEEIAAAVGCSVQNVHVRVHRGRKKLATALARYQDQQATGKDRPNPGKASHD